MIDTACQGKGKFGKLGGEKSCIVNPRRACAARVTVVVLCVCMYVCPNTLFWQYAQLEV